jgi:hypothetical protein
LIPRKLKELVFPKKRNKHTPPKKEEAVHKVPPCGDPPSSNAEPVDFAVCQKLGGIAEPIMNTHNMAIPLLQADSFKEGQLDAEAFANLECFVVVAQGAFFFTNQK